MVTCEFCYHLGTVTGGLLLQALEISHVKPVVARIDGKPYQPTDRDSLRSYLEKTAFPTSFEFYENTDYQDPGFCMFTVRHMALQNVIWTQEDFSVSDLLRLDALSQIPGFNYGYLLPFELYQAQDQESPGSDSPQFPFTHECIPGMSSLLGTRMWFGQFTQEKLNMEALDQFEDFEINKSPGNPTIVNFCKASIEEQDFPIFKKLRTALGFDNLVV